MPAHIPPVSPARPRSAMAAFLASPLALLEECTRQVLDMVSAGPDSRPGLDAGMARALAALPARHTLDMLAGARRITSAYREAARERAGMSGALAPFTCGIVNAKSGLCSENCAFCAQSRHHETGVQVYGLRDGEILLDRARALADAGVDRYGIVTSGNTVNERELDRLCETAMRISEHTGISLCASLGQLTPERAQRLRQAGFASYHHNLETARSFFPSICSSHSYEDDVDTVRHALDAGFRVCSGGIFGLGESRDQRVELACTLRELGVHSLPINFLNPIPGTRLADQPLLEPFEALRALALMRYLLPDRDILVAGGRERTLGEFQSWVGLAGANGLMVGNYLTTSGRDLADDMAMLDAMGLL